MALKVLAQFKEKNRELLAMEFLAYKNSKQYKKAFKQLAFNISIDGIGKKDEYIRTGTVWQKKKENIKKLMRSYYQDCILIQLVCQNQIY